MTRGEPPIGRITTSAYDIPTDTPEADGTLEWDSTTLVVVEIEGGGETGLGYTYSDASITALIEGKLSALISGRSVFNVAGANAALWRGIRNLGRSGLVATAISAIDAALWDLKAKPLGVPAATLLGFCRPNIEIYGSGGFTNRRDGCSAVKMKIGIQPDRDPARVRAARGAIAEAKLFIDANGAFAAKQALGLASRFADAGVVWFEEPVSSDDTIGLASLRSGSPAGMDIAAGEYGYNLDDFHRLLPVVDVLQADMTRCGGITGFMRVAAVCEAHHVDLSGHCAPALHLHVACAVPQLRHLEWFHDHVRIEHMLFDGAPMPRDGRIAPDLSRPGYGLEFRRGDADRFRVV